MIRNVFEKILDDQKLTDGERMEFLAWADRQEADAMTPRGMESAQEKTIQNAASLVDMIASRGMIKQLSDVTRHAGVLMAGEFRVGNDNAPGDGFTGGRFGYPGFDYGGTEYFLAGVTNDVLQVGLSLTDGKLYAGGGNTIIDASGISMVNSLTSWFRFQDASGSYANVTIACTPGNDFEFTNLSRSPNGAISFFIKDTAGTTLRTLRILEDPANANVAQMDFSPNTNGSKFSMGGEVVIWSQKHDVETIFNEGGYRITHRFEGDTDPNLLILNGTLDAIGIGAAASASYKLIVHGDFAVDGNAVFNPNGDAINLVHYDSSANLMFSSEAAVGVGIGAAAESGYKLKVTGAAKITGNLKAASIENDTGLAAGTYTATLNNTTNVSSSSGGATFKYVRVGSMVIVSGQLSVTPTAGGSTATTLGISLPIASNLAAATDLHGNATAQATGTVGNLTGDATNDWANLNFLSPTTSAMTWKVVFMYIVL